MHFYTFTYLLLHHRKLRKLRDTLLLIFSTSPAACWWSSSSSFDMETLLYTVKRCNLHIHSESWSKFVFFGERRMLTRVIFKIRVIFGVLFERRKVDKKSKPTRKLKHTNYSRVFWIFLPNDIKIDLYNFELYRFKIGAFFWDTV